MARLTDDEWEKARILYEVEKMTFSEIAQRMNVAASSVKRTCDRQGWNREKTQQLVIKNVIANKWLESIEEETQKESRQMQQALRLKVREGMTLLGSSENMAYVAKSISDLAVKKVDSIMINGNPTDDQLHEIMKHIQLHNEAAKIPLKLFEIENKTPDTSININNNQTPSIIERVIIDHEITN
jgi:predicted DNA-binding protein (UPF0251 family)